MTLHKVSVHLLSISVYDTLHEWSDIVVSPKSDAIIFLPFKPSYIFELALDLTYREKKMIRKMFLKEL